MSQPSEEEESPALRGLITEIREEVKALKEELLGETEKSQLLTREEASGYLRISTRTLDDMEEAGEIQATRIRGRVLYHREILDAFIRRQSRKNS